MRLPQKVAVVTGGASGIGRAICDLFAQEGASLVVADTDSEGGEETSRRINSAGGQAIFARMDVSKEPDVANMVEAALSSFGGIDILVNNAAAFVFRQVEDVTDSDWQRVISVNLMGAAYCTKHVLPAMKSRGGGAIVNMGSIGGLTAGFTDQSDRFLTPGNVQVADSYPRSHFGKGQCGGPAYPGTPARHQRHSTVKCHVLSLQHRQPYVGTTKKTGKRRVVGSRGYSGRAPVYSNGVLRARFCGLFHRTRPPNRSRSASGGVFSLVPWHHRFAQVGRPINSGCAHPRPFDCPLSLL